MMDKVDSHAQQVDDLPLEAGILPEAEGGLSVGAFECVDEKCSLLTPEQKLGSRKGGSQDHISELYLSSGNGSSDLSTKEGSETVYSSSSSSSSDAESGTYNLHMKKYLLEHVNGNEGLHPVDSQADKEKKDALYEELLEKVANYEVELKFTKEKLESSQEEIARLKYENLTLVEELGSTIEKLRTSEGEMERMENKLRDEFQETQHQLQSQLDLANQNVDLLQAELASERRLASQLQEMIKKTTNDLSDYGREIEELKLALQDTQEDFSKDRLTFQSEIASLQEQKGSLDSKINESECRNKLLEEQVKQLNMELFQRCELVESLNKSFDASKLSYDMLMAEKDEVFAKVQTLGAELTCRDIKVRNLEDRVSQLGVENGKLIAELEKMAKTVEELKMKVTDQEKELEMQRGIICDRAEEKREAIRQLCFSLEHYRNGYHELLQAFVRHKQPLVFAS